MSLDNFAADCQPDACSFILVAAMESLKNLKDTITILRVDSDAVVCHTQRVDRDVVIAGGVSSPEWIAGRQPSPRHKHERPPVFLQAY